MDDQVVIIAAEIDWDWCPDGCGFPTDDPYGGPCAACWSAIDECEQAVKDGTDA
jgi:hypothetical protein